MILILQVISGMFLRSQELNPEQQKYVEDVIEDLSENAEEDADFTDVFNDLVQYSIHPLNLNTATNEELESLKILNNFQIAGILDYRNKVGIIQSVYELGYLPGFREEDVNALSRFVTCNNRELSDSLKISLLKDSKNLAILKYQRVVEKQAGYIPISDSVLNIDPNKTRYLGSPDKIYARYEFKIKDNLEAGFVMEKDPGEEYFKGSNRQGFDFYSGHLIYRDNKKFIRSVVIGDYRIQTGQGLLMWSGYSCSKSIYVSDISKRSAVLKGSLSADENRFLRGAAITLGIKKLSWTFYGSTHKIDASLTSDSTGTNYFTSLTETGYHNTPLEISKENNLLLSIAGTSLRYDANRLHLGINGIYTSFGKQPQNVENLYYKYSPSGNEVLGMSTDYRYMGKKGQFFGETSYSNDALATLNGMLIYLTPEINLGMVHRYYQTTYYSYFANAFSENSSIANENGLFLGGEIKQENFHLRFYGDVFSFPWLKYQVNAPSEGSEMMGELGYTLKNGDISLRYKRQEKPKNYTDNEAIISDIIPFINENYRLNFTYSVKEKIKLQSRLEFSKAGFRDSTVHFGYLVLQDIIVQNLRFPVDFIFRIGYFNAVDYNTRIYTYERDVLYAYSSQMFYGKGWRWMAMAKWKPQEWVTLYLKFGQSVYPGEKSIGTGLNEINSSHRSEIKFESVFRF